MQSLTVHQIGTIFETRIIEIVERLRPYANQGVLYGSQTVRSSLLRDIDLLLITNNNATNRIFSIVAELQNRFSQIIHAIIISDEDLETNPYFRQFIQEGVVLWDARNTVCENL